MTTMVVIGGDAAGMSAASQLVRSGITDVVVFERGGLTSYAACGLPYFVGGLVPSVDRLVARSPEQHRANGIDVRLGTEVTAIDLRANEVLTRRLDTGDESRTGFDRLLVATGATGVVPPLPGIDTPGVFQIRTIPDAVAIDEALRDRAPRRAVVIGAGYIGVEMVEALLLRGLRVTVVERLDQPMTTLDADMAARVADRIRALGVDLHLGATVEAIDAGDGGWVRAVRTSAGAFDADLVVLALGARPATRLAVAAGIALGPTGAIATDDRMATSVPGVWAAGDCAESRHRVTGAPTWVALGTHANKQGRVAGIAMAGGSASFPGVVGTAVTKVSGTEIGRTGLSEREAVAAGFDVVSSVVEAGTRAHYYPDGEPMTVKIVAERATGRMLGAQIVGGREAAKRIDALAVAVWNAMSVEDVAQLDLGYAPPFAPVWDAGLIAARSAAAQRN